MIDRYKAAFCKDFSINISDHVFDTLIDNGQITEKTMKWYLIYSEFPALQIELGNMKAYYVLADRYKYHYNFIPKIIELVRNSMK